MMSSEVGAVTAEGLSVLSQSPEDHMDLVFVHGLNGHPLKTWTDPKTGFFWPRHLILGVRTMTYGYRVQFKGGGTNLMGIGEHANLLLLSLRNERRGNQCRRPLAFICHSLGGLVVKKASIISSRQIAFADIYRSMKHVFFFGTPHKGSQFLGKPEIGVLEKIVKAAAVEIPPNIRPSLKQGSDELFRINIDFAGILKDINVVNFYEEMPLNLKAMNEIIVDRDSAVMHYDQESFGLARDHRSIVRYSGTDDHIYLMIKKTLEEKFTLVLPDEIEGKQGYEQLKKDCFQSLKYEGFDDRFRAINQPIAKTFEWVWEPHTGFNTWLDEKRSLFWILGKPGSGKSTLLKKMLSQSQLSRKTETSIFAGFFFSNGGSEFERSIEGMLRSLIIRIIQMDELFLPLVLSQYEEQLIYQISDDEPVDWDIQTLRHMLCTMIRSGPVSRNICFFIDALDECTDSSVKELTTLFRELTDEENSVSVKICFTSRQLPANLPSLYPGFILEDKIQADIETYVDYRLRSVDLPSTNVSEESKLKSEMAKRADACFLWIDLVVPELDRGCEDGNDMTWLYQRLANTPKKLNNIFITLLENVADEYIPQTNAMLAVALAAFRSLTLAEFHYALALNEEIISSASSSGTHDDVPDTKQLTKQLYSRTGGLLEAKYLRDDEKVPKADRYVVRFLHQTVKDFLLERKDGDVSRILSPKSLLRLGHEQLSSGCCSYLFLEETQKIPDYIRGMHLQIGNALHGIEAQITAIDRLWPFLTYSVDNWPFHFMQSEALGTPQTKLLQLMETSKSSHFEGWRYLYNWLNPSQKYSIETSPLSVAIAYNLLSFTEVKIKEGVDLNVALEDGGHYLHLAALKGHSRMVSLLIKSGAKINARGGYFGSALEAAASIGSGEILSNLLENGASFNVPGVDLEKALSTALDSGHEEVFNIILGQGNNQASPGGWFCSAALISAASYGSSRIVRTLLDRGVDYNTWDGNRMNALLLACVADSEKTVRFLVDSGADLNARTPGGSTVLHWACLNKSRSLVKYLIQMGADLMAEDNDGDNILHWASMNESPDVLAYLLQLRQLDVNAQSYFGHTPIHRACSAGKPVHIKLLYKAGADLRIKDNDGGTVFHWAQLNKDPKVILPTLLDYSKSINTTDKAGISPLHFTAEFENTDTFQFMEQRGANLHIRDHDDTTILHSVSRNCLPVSTALLSYILDKKIFDVSATDSSGRTPLHYAINPPLEGSILLRSLRSDYEVDPVCRLANVNLLLNAGANINAVDDYGNTPLHLAAWVDSGTTVRELIQRGADRTVRDCSGHLAIKLASENWVRDIIRGEENIEEEDSDEEK